jgi:hypothetical protein
MSRLTRKIWLGVGAFSIVSLGTGGEVPAQHKGHGAPPAAAGKDSGALANPQAGEAYLTDGGPKDTRIRVYRDIVLMRGHLLIGAELIELGFWDEALPHFLHPTEELYGLMERYIKLHRVTPFDRQLKAQAQAVKARNKAAYFQAARVVDERLSGALTSFRRYMTAQPFTSYTMRTVVEVLKIARSEYEAAIEGTKFAKPVEYQDSRGFVIYVERILKAQEADYRRVDSARFDQLLSLLVDMKRAWPSPMPPPNPVVPAETVATWVKSFEAAAERFH